MLEVSHQAGLCLPQSSSGKQRARSTKILKSATEPVEQKLEGPEISKESNVEPTSLEQVLDPQSEPTVTFLFTLLNTPEPKDSESDSDTQEDQFLDQEDWGPQQTSEEMRQLQNDCLRLQKKLITSQANHIALEKKLQNMPTLLYQNLTERTLAQVGKTEVNPEEEVTQEEALARQALSTLMQVVDQQLDVARRIQARASSLEPPNPLPLTTLLSEGNSVQPPATPSQQPPPSQSALVGPKATDLPPTQEAISPAGSSPVPSNKH